jgi:hypothetical protein
LNQPELYIAVFRHEYGVDCFTFYFVPNGDLKYPSPRKVAERFTIDFEPEKGETFELVPAHRPDMETLSAEHIGRKTVAPACWWEDGEEGWLDEDNEDDLESNVPCVACGRKDLPLHIDGRCGACGRGPTTDDQRSSGIEIRLSCYGITIHLDRDPAFKDPGCGRITSDLKASDATVRPFNNAIDGLEALILAHACVGIDVTSPTYVEGIETAIEAITNQYGP